MKITKHQLKRIIQEVILREQGCADREAGCIRQGKDGTWYILNNKKGGVWRKGFKSKKAAEDVLKVPAVHG